MRKIEIKNLVSVFQVSDLEKSLEWYKRWLGEPDVIPMEGMAEYQIGSDAWLQLSCDEGIKKEAGSVVLGVADLNLTKQILEENAINTGEIVDYEVVLVLDIFDIDGNKITFVQEV